MKTKIKEILEKLENKRVGLFIDNANWFYPQRELGWDIDFKKLTVLLKKYFKIKILNLYAGTPLDFKDQKRFQKFADKLKKTGIEVITKKLKKIWLDRKYKKFIYKCNFDVEIALDVARSINNIDLLIIGSGDSDFIAVKKYCLENKKKFLALCFSRGVSWEIRQGYHIFLDEIKDKIQEIKTPPKRGDNNK